VYRAHGSARFYEEVITQTASKLPVSAGNFFVFTV